MGKLDQFFQGNLLGKKIENFPYPEKFCRHCEREMSLERAIHMNELLDYKALYICKNPNCPAFDFPAHKAHAHVYYSTPDAFKNLELHRIMYQREEKDGI